MWSTVLRSCRVWSTPVLQMVLRTKTFPTSQMTEYAESTLAQRISMISGVAQVQVLGAPRYAVRVDVDPRQLAANTIGIDEIARADYETADPQIVEEFEAFAAGWNQFLDDNTDLTGWCAGEPWVFKVSGADVYSYARAIALTASSAQLVSYIAAATPPEPTADTTVPSTDDADTSSTTSAAAAFEELDDQPIASNGWAIGADRTTGGQGGLLLANPHFPWEGELRFWEVQLLCISYSVSAYFTFLNTQSLDISTLAKRHTKI